jgi:hypothetical protein
MLDEILYEEVEDCVVGRGNGAAHVRRALICVAPCSQLPRIIQKFVR